MIKGQGGSSLPAAALLGVILSMRFNKQAANQGGIANFNRRFGWIALYYLTDCFSVGYIHCQITTIQVFVLSGVSIHFLLPCHIYTLSVKALEL